MIRIYKAYLNSNNINGTYFHDCLLRNFSQESSCSLNPYICFTTSFCKEQQTGLIRTYHKT